jgi:ABC-type spermidine/putrescine transport system permease subunit II
VVAAAVDMAAVLPTPGVLVVAHSVHSVPQAALLFRSQCRRMQFHMETGAETLLAGRPTTVLVAAVHLQLVSIDQIVATRPLQVAQD